jgi:hypothetical protein
MHVSSVRQWTPVCGLERIEHSLFAPSLVGPHAVSLPVAALAHGESVGVTFFALRCAHLKATIEGIDLTSFGSQRYSIEVIDEQFGMKQADNFDYLLFTHPLGHAPRK